MAGSSEMEEERDVVVGEREAMAMTAAAGL
jgi:hypothetical protein